MAFLLLSSRHVVHGGCGSWSATDALVEGGNALLEGVMHMTTQFNGGGAGADADPIKEEEGLC